MKQVKNIVRSKWPFYQNTIAVDDVSDKTSGVIYFNMQDRVVQKVYREFLININIQIIKEFEIKIIT